MANPFACGKLQMTTMKMALHSKDNTSQKVQNTINQATNSMDIDQGGIKHASNSHWCLEFCKVNLQKFNDGDALRELVSYFFRDSFGKEIFHIYSQDGITAITSPQKLFDTLEEFHQFFQVESIAIATNSLLYFESSPWQKYSSTKGATFSNT